jgi:hypothetical protein
VVAYTVDEVIQRKRNGRSSGGGDLTAETRRAQRICHKDMETQRSLIEEGTLELAKIPAKGGRFSNRPHGVACPVSAAVLPFTLEVRDER